MGQLVAVPGLTGKPQYLVNLGHVVRVARLLDAGGKEIGTTFFMSDRAYADSAWRLEDWGEAALGKGGDA